MVEYLHVTTSDLSFLHLGILFYGKCNSGNSSINFVHRHEEREREKKKVKFDGIYRIIHYRSTVLGMTNHISYTIGLCQSGKEQNLKKEHQPNFYDKVIYKDAQIKRN